jgi:hypothetical protein
MKNLGLDMSFNRRWIQQAFRQRPLCKIIWEPNFAKVRWAFQAMSLAQKFSMSKISVKVR